MSEPVFLVVIQGRVLSYLWRRRMKGYRVNLVIARGEKKKMLYIVEQSSCEVNSIANEIDSLISWN